MTEAKEMIVKPARAFFRVCLLIGCKEDGMIGLQTGESFVDQRRHSSE